jgi:hypothetical protein
MLIVFGQTKPSMTREKIKNLSAWDDEVAGVLALQQRTWPWQSFFDAKLAAGLP